MAHKLKTNVYLESAQLEELRALSTRSGTPVAAIVRRAIDREIAPRPISWTRFVTPDFVAELSPLEVRVLATMIARAEGRL